ncbi:MAG: N-acetylmuramic acid 6-phosphate etherase [Pseudomonadota bacterium]
MPSNTEMMHAQSQGIDLLPPNDIALILLRAQAEAAEAAIRSSDAICAAAAAMARTLSDGGKLYYIAAGSSGLMAAADAMELGGTFGIHPDQVQIVMAGGIPTSAQMPGGTEDDTAGLNENLAPLSPLDTVIAVTASGGTRYTVAAAEIARAKGASVIGIANNPGSRLLDIADIPVLLQTPPEVLSGSTRLGAGTAQKIALNTLSTLMAVELGHVYDGMMVNVVADNEKLMHRASGIVETIAGVGTTVAADALRQTGGLVKPAVLIASGAGSPEDANARLDRANGNLREALAMLETR